MVQIAARISKEEKDKLEQYCKEKDIKVSQLIRWAIKDYLKNIEEQESKRYGW